MTHTSKHPLPFKSMSIKKWLLVVAFLCSVGGGLYVYGQQSLAVQVVTPQVQNMAESVTEVGTLACQKTITLYAETSGTVKQVKVDLGDWVKPQTLVASFEDDTLKLQLEDANAKIHAAKAALEGTALGVIANKMDLAKLSVSEAQRQVSVLETTYNQTKALVESGATSAEELKTATSLLNAAKHLLKAAEVTYADVAAGVPNYQKKQLQAQLEQALIYRSTLQLAEDHLQVYAPMTGVVLERQVDSCQVVQAGAPLMTIGDPTQLEVLVDLLSDDVEALSLGDSAEFRAPYLGDTLLEGHVKKIAPMAKETLSTLGVSQKRIPVTLALDTSSTLLKPGMPLEVTLILKQKQNVLSVPATAVFEDQRGKAVYGVRDGQLIILPVETGISTGDYIEILSGLTQSDQVVTGSLTHLSPGMKVHVD